MTVGMAVVEEHKAGRPPGNESQTSIPIVIAKCSLWGALQTDCLSRLQRKTPDECRLLPMQSVLRSPTYQPEIAENGHNLRFSLEMKARILCSPDCMAERAVWR
jgi:hypothetical protein